MKRLLVPVLDLGLRIARRLRFFPFSLVFLAIGAVLRRIDLRRDRALHRRFDLSDAEAGYAQLLRAGPGAADLVVDCGSAGSAAADAGRPAPATILAASLANPAIRSIGFYFDQAALAEDLPLWGRALPRDSGTPVRPVPYAGAQREGELLLARLAGGRLVYVLDDAQLSLQEAQALAAESPEFLFVDLACRGSLPPGERPGNLVPLGAAGLGLHLKVALVRSADMYIGSDPVLAAAAPRATALAALRVQGGLRDRLRARPAAGDTIH